jgi:hypothetical protein
MPDATSDELSKLTVRQLGKMWSFYFKSGGRNVAKVRPKKKADFVADIAGIDPQERGEVIRGLIQHWISEYGPSSMSQGVLGSSLLGR